MRDSVRALKKDLLIKIGIHEGPCLAVTLNDRLDYFGQTVNIAARVQGSLTRARSSPPSRWSSIRRPPS
jgi:class 3 adenylate cyclase